MIQFASARPMPKVHYDGRLYSHFVSYTSLEDICEKLLDAVFSIRIRSGSNIVCPVSNRRANIHRHLGVALKKPRLKCIVESKNVRKDKNLPVTIDPGSNPYSGNPYGFRDTRRHPCGNKLEDYRKRACFLQTPGFADQSRRAYLFAPL